MTDSELMLQFRVCSPLLLFRNFPLIVTLTFLISVFVVRYSLTSLRNVPLPVRKLLTSSMRLLVLKHPPDMTMGNLPCPANEHIAAAHRLLLRPTDRVPPVNIIGILLKRCVV